MKLQDYLATLLDCEFKKMCDYDKLDFEALVNTYGLSTDLENPFDDIDELIRLINILELDKKHRLARKTGKEVTKFKWVIYGCNNYFRVMKTKEFDNEYPIIPFSIVVEGSDIWTALSKVTYMFKIKHPIRIIG